jgi:oligopeptide/dipeptide ABC transporter ATP-binding protein
VTKPLLTVRGLRVEFGELPRILSPVVDVSFDVAAGERLGIVGESGSGKTLTALSIIGLVPQDGQLAAGSVRFAGQELVGQPPRALNRLRGDKIAMIFQDPSASLNPSLKVGYQIAEVVALHQRVNGKEARRRAVDALSLLNLSDPARVADAYPFQLSGGMRQRVMIAMMLSCHPKLLIADEPTTSVDVTTQMQILKELDALIRRLGTSIILITHDLGVVANFTDRTAVIYGGVTCEIAPTAQLLRSPQHPYTQALLEAMIDLDHLGRRPQAIPGDPSDPGRTSQGCPFVLRCPAALPQCREERPRLRQVADNHLAACHLFPSDKPA